MQEPQKIIESALKEGRTTLSEYESKLVLTHYQIPIAREKLCKDSNDLKEAAREIGYPLVLKGNSPDIAHKTENDLIRLDIRNEAEAGQAFNEIMGRMNGSSGTSFSSGDGQGKTRIFGRSNTGPSIRTLCLVWSGRNIYRSA